MAPWIAHPLDQGVWVPCTGAQRYSEIQRIASVALIDRSVVMA